MADFDFSTLVTDRAPADLTLLRDLLSTPMEDWTEEQLAQFNQAASKGAYNYTDLNRVSQCMEYLDETLRSYGYETGYQRIEIPHKGGGGGRLPSGYTELQYIESSGTQYINTGYKPSSQTQLVMTISDFAGGAWKNFYGVRTTASLTDSKQFALGTTSPATTLRCDYFGSNATMTVTEYTGKTIIDHDKETLTAYGQSISNPVSSEAAGNLELILFGFNSAGSIANLATFKLYSCRIYENQIIIHNFVPCSNENGTVGLYDIENDEFYQNAGTGTFTAGDEVDLPEPEPGEVLDPYTWYESDTPTASLMDEYLSNVSALRAVLCLPETTPEVPADMDGLTMDEANAIEGILLVIEDYLTALQKIFLRSGMAWAVSGGPGFYFVN